MCTALQGVVIKSSYRDGFCPPDTSWKLIQIISVNSMDMWRYIGDLDNAAEAGVIKSTPGRWKMNLQRRINGLLVFV